MALVELTRPLHLSFGGVLQGTYTMNGTTTRVALILSMRRAGTIDTVGFRLASAGSVQTVKVSLQNVTTQGAGTSQTAVPDGSIDQFRTITPAAGWNETGSITSDGTNGGTKRTVAVNELVAVVFEWNGASGSIVFDGIRQGNAVLTGTYNGSWTFVQSFPIIHALKLTDGAYVASGVQPAGSGYGQTTFSQNGTPDEVALRFKSPIGGRLLGIHAIENTAARLFDVVLYNSAGSVVDSVSWDSDRNAVLGAGNAYPELIVFPTNPVITANALYRISIKPQSGASTITYASHSYPTTAVKSAAPGGVEFYWSERTDGGSWTDTTTKAMQTALVFSHIDTPANTIVGGLLQRYGWNGLADPSLFGSVGNLSASGHRQAYLFNAPKAGTLHSVEWLNGTVTTARDLKVSFQDISSAAPDNTIDQYRVVPQASLSTGAWVVPPGPMTSDGTNTGTKRTVTLGETVCVVWQFDSTVGSLSVFNHIGNGQSVTLGWPCRAFSTDSGASWTLQDSLPSLVVKYDDGTYELVSPSTLPLTTFTTRTYNSSSSPDEYAQRFILPFQTILNGIRFYGDCDGAFDVVLYNAANTAIATRSLSDSDVYQMRETASGREWEVIFNTPANIAPGAEYRIAIKPTGANNVVVYQANATSQTIRETVDSAAYISSRTDAGAWTDTLTGWLWCELLLAQTFSSATVTGIQKVTQIVTRFGIDEDADNDPPPTIGNGGVTACSGGGTVASGSNPSAGTSLATVSTPLTWIEITPISGSVKYYSNVSIPHGTHKQGRIERLGTITRVLADADHGYETARDTLSLIDDDGELRTLAISGTLKNARVDIFTADLATVQASGTPWRHFRALVDSYEAKSDRLFDLNLIDILTARLTSIDADDLQVPVKLIGSAISDFNALDRMFDKPVPELYGSLSDEAESEPEGTWECKHVGFQTLTGDEDLGNVAAFLVGLGAHKKIQSVFAADPNGEDPPTTRVKVGTSAFGDWRTDTDAWLLVPKQTGWPEAADYSTRDSQRYTLIFGKDGHPSVMQAVQNRIPLVINLCARESVGDTSGTMISSGPRALQHWLNNTVLQQATGDWLSVATYGDYSIIDTSTVATVHSICDALGYVCAGVVGADFRQQSWRDVVADFCRSFGMDVGINRHGQCVLVKLDVSATGSGATAFTPSEILEHSVTVDHRLDAVENTIRYVYARNYKTTLPDLTPAEGARLYRDPYDGEWGSGLQILDDSTSITNLGGDPKGVRRSQLQEYHFVRDSTTADAVAQERLDLLSPAQGRVEASFDLSLKDGCALELGDLITVEHWDLPWTGSRRCQVRGLATNLDDLTIRVTARDVDDLLA